MRYKLKKLLGMPLVFLIMTLAALATWWGYQNNQEAYIERECINSLKNKVAYHLTVQTNYASNNVVLLKGLVPKVASVSRQSSKSEFYLQFKNTLHQQQSSEMLLHIQSVASKASAANSAMNAELDLSYMVNVEKNCAITVLYPLNGESNSFVEGLLLLFDMRLASSPSFQWTLEQQDKTGVYEAHYKVVCSSKEQLDIKRQRTKYLSLVSNLATDDFRAQIIESNSVASLKPNTFWYSGINGVEDLSILKNGTAAIQTRVNFELARMANDFVIPQLNQQAMVTSKKNTHTELSNIVGNDIKMAKQVRSYPSQEDILQRFHQIILEGNMPNALAVLVEALKHKPSFSAQLHTWILDGTIKEENVALSMLALSEASTDEAVAVLRNMFESQSLSAQRRSQAAFAISSVHPPSIKNAAALASQLDKFSADQNYTSRSALLALGKMSRSVSKQDTATKSFIQHTIENQFQLASNDQAIMATLSAAHNSGDVNLYPMVRSQLSSASPRVRRLALQAVASLNAPSARFDVLTYIEDEPVSRTKSEAIDTLTKILKNNETTASSEEINLVNSILKQATNADIKKSSISFLGSAVMASSARKALMEQVEVETDPEVLILLGQLLTPEELKGVSR